MSVRNSLKAGLALLFAGGLVALSPAVLSAARAENPPASAIPDDAMAVIGRMGKTLQAKEFSFHAHTFRAYAGPNGELLHIAHTTKTFVHRPDRLSVEVTGDDGSNKFFYDGKTLVVYSLEQKKYASIPVTGNIDQMIDVAEKRLGTDFPLADLLTDDPAKSVLSGVTSGGQVGTSIINGVPCRHFFFNQADDLDLELWLEDNEKALPRRFVVTYRSLPGRPSFIAELSDWDFSTKIPDAAFVFQPPAGVVQVDVKAGNASAPAPAK
ncbi:MAG TPA: DUF2092 domain-containing protein [Stellaceae bacterium]|nr:DUF2092 domain-containing protein [Stellaceae bacterium]